MTLSMKKLIVLLAASLLAAVSLNAQSVFSGSQLTEYTIEKSESLGGAAKMAGDVVVGYTTGQISGKITFNSKTKTISFKDRTIRYKDSALKIENFENSSLTSTNATLLENDGNVILQIIEDYKKQTVNILIQWPDYSASRIFAKFKGSRGLR